MVRVWRIVKARHAGTAFSGDGAKTYGARWSSPGVAVVYVAGSKSLAMLERLVHLGSGELMERYAIFEVTFDEALMAVIDVAILPRSWRKSPPPAALGHIGDTWVASGESAILRVPSVIVPNEYNYLLNPAHPHFNKIKIVVRQPARFDPRLINTPVS